MLFHSLFDDEGIALSRGSNPRGTNEATGVADEAAEMNAQWDAHKMQVAFMISAVRGGA
ncbi:hypothetical protein T492DRAFT_894245 [Pavlovales sp. CCMP2436]|nr:hypothetical protein T492DRAFT_894245 [Pavlovales sp. CCMP2436]